MKVEEIIKLTCNYLQLDDILKLNVLGGNQSFTDETQKDFNLLLTCANLVNNQIASEYIKLFKTAQVKSSDGMISYNIITNEKLHEIYAVKDKYGNRLIYKTFADYLKTVSGEVEITYTYLPQKVELASDINYYKTKISERVFAYGVAAEYCFIKGLYDDSTMWDLRLKNSLMATSSKKGEIVVKPKRWL